MMKNKQMKNILKIMSVTVTMMSLSACGGGGGSSGGDNGYSTYQEMADKFKHDTVDVKYTLNGTKRPTCHNANDIGILAPDNNDEIKCVWYCGRYQGVKGRKGDTIHIFLDFKKSEETDEGVWELSDEFILEASPTLCRDI